MSSECPTHTFSSNIRDSTSKLDRWLSCSTAASDVHNYTVDLGSRHELGSDHAIISFCYNIPTVTTRPTPKREVYRPSQFPSALQNSLWRSVNDRMSMLRHHLEQLDPHSLTCDVLNSYFVTFSSSISKCCKRAHAMMPPPKKASRACLRKQQRLLRKLRSLKYKCSRDIPLSKHNRTTLKMLFPTVWLSTENRGYIPLLRKQIRITKQALTREMNRLTMSTDNAHSYFFEKRRKKFYDRQLRGKGHSSTLIHKITEPSTNTVHSTPEEVLRVTKEEASYVFRRPSSLPSNTPDWFEKLYDPDLHPSTHEKWLPLADRFTNEEILSVLRHHHHRAPGPDGISRELLYFFCSASQCKASISSNTLECVNLLLNLWFQSDFCPSHCSMGHVVTIPKPGLTHSTLYSDRRPLTLLNEIAKTATKILATRTRTILADTPSLLDAAQNGFIQEGNVDGPIRFLFDRIKQTQSKHSDLFVIAYDQSKAYDSIQHWHVELALKRFSWPQKAISFVLNFLSSACSRILTAHGLTDSFKLLNSIRQGCPFSPLIYVICIDPLHYLLRSKAMELNLGVNWGPQVHRQRDTSLGFADDTLTLNETPEAAHKCHTMVSTFFSVHSLSLNFKKTNARYLCNTHGRLFKLNQLDWGVGTAAIVWRGPEVPFRYLGVHVRLDLSPESHLAECSRKTLYPFLYNLRKSRMSLYHCVQAIREVVWPTIDFITRFYTIPLSFLTKWEAYFSSFLQQRAKSVNRRPISRSGLWCIFGMLNLTRHYLLTSISDHLIHLNSSRNRWQASTRNRVLYPSNYSTRSPLAFTRRSMKEPLSILGAARSHDIAVVPNPISTLAEDPMAPLKGPTLNLPPSKLSSTWRRILQHITPSTIVIGTGDRQKETVRWVILVHQPGTSETATASGQVFIPTATGLHHHLTAPAIACIAALKLLPRFITILCPSGSLVQQVTHPITTRKILRSPIRPLLRVLRTLVNEASNCRMKALTILPSTDPRNLHLHLYGEAKEFLRRMALTQVPPPSAFSTAEPPFILRISDLPYHGDYRNGLRQHLRTLQTNEWKQCKTHGSIARLLGKRIHSLLTCARNVLSPSDYYSAWLLDTLNSRLPIGTLYDCPDDIPCLLCGHDMGDTSLHYTLCSSLYSLQIHPRLPAAYPTAWRIPLHDLYSSMRQKLMEYDTLCARTLPQLQTPARERLLSHYFSYYASQQSDISLEPFRKLVTELAGYAPAALPSVKRLTDNISTSVLRITPLSQIVVIHPFHLPCKFDSWSIFQNANPIPHPLGAREWKTERNIRPLILFFSIEDPALLQELHPLLLSLAEKGRHCYLVTHLSYQDLQQSHASSPPVTYSLPDQTMSLWHYPTPSRASKTPLAPRAGELPWKHYYPEDAPEGWSPWVGAGTWALCLQNQIPHLPGPTMRSTCEPLPFLLGATVPHPSWTPWIPSRLRVTLLYLKRIYRLRRKSYERYRSYNPPT